MNSTDEFEKQMIAKQKRKVFGVSDSALAFIFVIVFPELIAAIFTVILIAVAGGSEGAQSLLSINWVYILYIICVQCSIGAVFFIYTKARKISPVLAGKIHIKFGWKNFALCILLALILLFGFNSFINMIFAVLGKIGYNPDASLPLPLTNFGWFVLNVILLAVLPAIFEELIYRGIIFNGLKKLNSRYAIWGSAVIFAFAHGSAMQLFYQFALGVLLAIVVMKTCSVVAGIVVHFVNNFTVVLINYICGKTESTAFNFGSSLNALEICLSILIAGVTVVAIYFLVKLLRPTQKLAEKEVAYTEGQFALSEGKNSLNIFMWASIITLVLWGLGTFM